MGPTVISRVALAGKGRLGTAVLNELLKANFQVTVLTRSASSIKDDVPPGVPVREVAYTSAESLQVALKNHDAVVSTVAGVAVLAKSLSLTQRSPRGSSTSFRRITP
ncbi:hypothetical protein BDW62DRAFT_185171 [Aspergillus aurantiobrunneus]